MNGHPGGDNFNMSCVQADFPGAKTLTISEPNIYNVAGNALAAISFSPV